MLTISNHENVRPVHIYCMQSTVFDKRSEANCFIHTEQLRQVLDFGKIIRLASEEVTHELIKTAF